MARNPDFPLKREIDEFLESQLKVYRDQPKRLLRDASSAKEVIRDHVDRWPYELLQNAEDAHATSVVISFTENTIYFADNGSGLPSGAVESLSGTHLSEKPAEAIGRKGLGFKSVYCVSAMPAVFSGPEGLFFDRDLAIAWLKEQGLGTKHVPYQWLPFWMSREDQRADDAELAALADARTVVRLPIADPKHLGTAQALLSAFEAQTLLNFRHVRQLQVKGCGPRDFTIAINPDKSSGLVQVRDTRRDAPTDWKTAARDLTTPEELLKTFDDDADRERARNVDIRVAVPLGGTGHVTPLKQHPKLYVYYPTEEPAPIRVLLHGDFLIKSDRTAIVSLKRTSFNQWVARELAALLVGFVSDNYTPNEPTANVRLLLRAPSLPSEGTGTILWDYTREQAKASLLLPDVTAQPRLKLSEALRLAIESGHAQARRILQETAHADALVHASFDKDVEAGKVLASLEVRALGETEVISAIRDNAVRLHADREWIWACWEWLADWVGEDEERLAKAKSLPVIPDGKGMIKGNEADVLFVTWADKKTKDKFPDWLPLRFIPDWLRDRLLKTPADSPVRSLAEHLRVGKPDSKLAVRALAKAAEDYWDNKTGDPARFLSLIVERKWFETEERPDGLSYCPVPVLVGGSKVQTWAPAQDAYLGEAWGEKRLAQLFEGNDEVQWAQPLPGVAAKEQLRPVYSWLGMRACPWIFRDEEALALANERVRVGRLLPSKTGIGEIPAPTLLEHVDLATLPGERASILLFLLASNWENYYEHEAHVRIEYKYYSWSSRSLPCLWWAQVLSQLMPPLKGYIAHRVPLQECWIAGETLKRLGSLLPCIDLGALSKTEEATVLEWLRNVVKLRERPDQLADSELKDILTTRIPTLIPEPSCIEKKQRDHVARWYGALLGAIQQRDGNKPDLSDCPLLCARGKEWRYISDEDVWLADDHGAALAFKEEIWTISMREILHKAAQTVLGVRSLAENSNSTFHHDPAPPEWKENTGHRHLRTMLDDVKRFLFAWVSHARQDHDDVELRVAINALRIQFAHNLKASIQLADVEGTRDIARAYAVEGDLLMIDAEQAAEGSLARALAHAVGRRNDAELFELLLRCPDDEARTRKLVDDREVPESELTRYLSEWMDGIPEPEVPTGPEPADDEDSSGSEIPTTQVPETPAAPPDDTGESRPPPGDKPPPTAPKEKRRLKLKSPSKVTLTEIELTTQPGRTGGGGGGGSGTGADVLSDAERRLVEDSSREFAEAELAKRGYDVEQMPRQNPGFDIRAAKTGEPTLLVEVKGHLGRANIVDLTAREYKEYVRCLESSDTRWELWNIQDLSSEREGDVLLSRHQLIPDEALVGVRGLRVDLRRCPTKDD